MKNIEKNHFGNSRKIRIYCVEFGKTVNATLLHMIRSEIAWRIISI